MPNIRALSVSLLASFLKTKSELRDGKPVLMRLAELNFIDDGTGKPVGINEHIGRRPIAAFGNPDGDLEVPEWAKGGGRRQHQLRYFRLEVGEVCDRNAC